MISWSHTTLIKIIYPDYDLLFADLKRPESVPKFIILIIIHVQHLIGANSSVYICAWDMTQVLPASRDIQSVPLIPTPLNVAGIPGSPLTTPR